MNKFYTTLFLSVLLFFACTGNKHSDNDNSASAVYDTTKNAKGETIIKDKGGNIVKTYAPGTLPEKNISLSQTNTYQKGSGDGPYYLYGIYTNGERGHIT